MTVGQPGVSQPKQFLISKMDASQNGFQMRLVGGYQMAFEIFQGNALLTIEAITDAEGFGTDRPRDTSGWLTARNQALLALHD